MMVSAGCSCSVSGCALSSVATVSCCRSHRSPLSPLGVPGDGGRLVFLLRPSIDTAVMVAVLSSVATVSCCRSHRSDVATIADGQTVRRLGDGVGWVFLLRVRVCFVIGGHCQLLPVMVAVALVFLLCVPGAPLSSVRLDCQLLPPLPVSW